MTEPDLSQTTWPEWTILRPVSDTTYQGECFRHTTETLSEEVDYVEAITWANEQHGSCEQLPTVEETIEEESKE
jgi:hypothetical protein